MDDLFKTIPRTLEGLEEAVSDILPGQEEKTLQSIREMLLEVRIRNEYRLQKKARGRGHSEEIKRELSQKYFNTPNRIKLIEKIIYYKA